MCAENPAQEALYLMQRTQPYFNVIADFVAEKNAYIRLLNGVLLHYGPVVKVPGSTPKAQI